MPERDVTPPTHPRPLPMPPPPQGSAGIPRSPAAGKAWSPGRIAAVLLAALAVGGAVGAGVLVLQNDGSDARATTVTPSTEVATDSEPQRIGNGGAGSSAAEPAAPAASATQTYRAYSPSDPSYGYTAHLPYGPGWSEPVESYPTGGALLRTTVRGPGGILLLIDHTPGEVPDLGGGYDSSRVVPQPAYGVATEYTFSTSELISECSSRPCVDYLIEDGSGGGWGVLGGGGSDFDLAKDTAAKVMRSIRGTA